MLWDCENCGVKAIAGGLDYCPTCRTPRPTEDVAGEPALTPAPEELEDAQPSGPFPPDGEVEASPPHDDEEQEAEETDGKDHSE